MRPQIVIILTFVLSFFNNTPMLAQLRSGETGPPPPVRTPPPPELPIDSGLLILLVIGIVFGCYVVLKKRQSNNVAE